MTATALTPPTELPLALQPLAKSHQADDIERELAELFMELFATHLRPGARRLNVYGMPHRGDFDVIERFVKADGLVMERANAQPYMAELFRAWRALNPRRGTAFLRYYLQLLFPNRWSITQLWQDPGQPYPARGDDGEAPGRFLTSRIRVMLSIEDPAALNPIVGSLRAVLPARFVLELTLRNDFLNDLGVASVLQFGMHQDFAGTVT